MQIAALTVQHETTHGRLYSCACQPFAFVGHPERTCSLVIKPCLEVYFEYKPDLNKSTCLVIDEKSDRQCGHLTAGKNPMNLKSHLSKSNTE